MAKFDLVMPKLGESIIEATITRWLKQTGDMIEEDDAIVEIATDKVDSEIPSPVEGKLIEVKYKEGDVVAVGEIIAVIETDAEGSEEPVEEEEQSSAEKAPSKSESEKAASKSETGKEESKTKSEKEDSKPEPEEVTSRPRVPTEKDEETTVTSETDEEDSSDRFYSPLVKNIAKTEGISLKELEKVQGSGKDGRITKNDVLTYLDERKKQPVKEKEDKADKQQMAAQETKSGQQAQQTQQTQQSTAAKPAPQVTAGQGDEIVEMDRMRKLIADHMVMSKDVSPHVTSYIEVDVTNMVLWREKVKDEFLKREKEKLTFTPLFVEAAAQALKELPGVNASVDGYKIILRKNINIGIAAALPTGNLIVPVIKNADQKNIIGLAKDVNSLADKARRNKLDPDDIQGGTFTITNLGTFGSLTGSPIINQPQVAILGLGVIKKKPVVLETETGDVIAIRHMVILSLSYDHRVVDGALGGQYLQKMQQILERFDLNRTI